MNVKDELESDFKQAMNAINFSNYNPNSKEFVNALLIGAMLHVLGYDKKDLEHDEYKEDSDNDDIDDELHSAKLYLQKYLDTKDELYKEMSKDELKHAEILIKKHQSKLLSANKKAKLKEQENLHASIQTQLKNLS